MIHHSVIAVIKESSETVGNLPHFFEMVKDRHCIMEKTMYIGKVPDTHTTNI